MSFPIFKLKLCLAILTTYTVIVVSSFSSVSMAENTISEKDIRQFDTFLAPLFKENCNTCHGEKKTKGKVDLVKIKHINDLLKKPKMLKEILEVIDFKDMPPEDETPLLESERTRSVKLLKKYLVQSVSLKTEQPKDSLRRLNRFQYNNTVRDLFGISQNIFPLPEKMMTRSENYLTQGKMPEQVSVTTNSFEPEGGFKNVRAFPQDLRAKHGFDNQGDQLHLSPLLLDSFLQLSVSILESPDFTPEQVTIWNQYFKAPTHYQEIKGNQAAVRQMLVERLRPFLTKAFRHPPSDEIVDRYTSYIMSCLQVGDPFVTAMKKVTSGILSSPLFIYRYPFRGENSEQYKLASRLSYYLWGSCPDESLLTLARKGTLSQPEILEKTVDRMLRDPKIERFLDAFPAQWMQLENMLAALPDKRKFRYFYSLKGKQHGTYRHMVLEPLLLFDTVFVENRSIVDLIQPDFNYRSGLLEQWYASDMKVPGLTKKKSLSLLITSRNYARHSRRISKRKKHKSKPLLLIKPRTKRS